MTNAQFARRLAIIAARSSDRVFDSLLLLDKAHEEVDVMLVHRTCTDLKRLIDSLVADSTKATKE